MSRDISKILQEWPYEPGTLNVRLIDGADGEARIQIRLDLGVLQLHTIGRPDGLHPHGYQSVLEYLEARADGIEPDPATDEPTEPEQFSLSEDECRQLREEAAQYYHRYMALLALEDYQGVVRDTTRNLRVIDLCAKHAESDSDRHELEPYRAYILMICARARAGRSVKLNEPKAALLAIDEGIGALQKHFEADGHPEMFDESNEVQMLRGMREALVPRLPVSQKMELRQRMRAAVEQENYELAAILRDELRQLRDDR